MGLAKSIYTCGILILKDLTVRILLHGPNRAVLVSSRRIRYALKPPLGDYSMTYIGQSIIPDVMWGSGEFQAGAFDPWGGVRVFTLERVPSRKIDISV